MSDFKKGIKIYNLFPSLYGSMDQWIKQFPRIKEMGFTHIYLNPITFCGFSGSMYSVSKHFEIAEQYIDKNSDLSAVDQLKQVVQEAKSYNLDFLFDIVVNHTAIDSPLIKEHPEWYQWKDGKVVQPGCLENGEWITWGDLAEIDNLNSSDRDNLWKYWLDYAAFYFDIGFVGFRADAAYQVPAELWNYLIENLSKKYENALFLAETLGCNIKDIIKLKDVGFTYMFNSSKWWNFNESWLIEETSKYIDHIGHFPSIGFPESHDTKRIFDEFTFDEALSRILFSNLFSTGFMMTSGMEYCYKKQVDVAKTTYEWKEEYGIDVTGYVKKCIDLKNSYKIFNQDKKIYPLAHSNEDNITAFCMESIEKDEKIVILFNKNSMHSQKTNIHYLFDVLNLSEDRRDLSVIKSSELNIEHNFNIEMKPSQLVILYNKAN